MLKEPGYFQQKSFSRNESAASDTNAVNDSGYHLSKIRALLIEGFSETELRNFCFDTSEFRPVYHELAELTGKAKIAGHLLEFADRRELINLLLIWAEENNPAKFARYQPYHVQDDLPQPTPHVIPSASEESPSPAALKSAEATTPPPASRDTLPFGRSDMEKASVIPSASEESSINQAKSMEIETRAKNFMVSASPVFDTPVITSANKEPPKTETKTAVITSANKEPPKTETKVAKTPPPDSPARRETPHFVRSDMKTATTTPPDRVTITNPIHLELVRVPAGEFLRGSDSTKDKYAQLDEQPQHRVYVSEFYIGKYPVTNEQYAAFVLATKYEAPYHWEKGKIPTGKEYHPVVYVTWDDAVAFCKWLSRETGSTFRLPTEAEWEKAARGMDGRIYPWGNKLDPVRLNSREKGPGDTTPVGKYSPGGDSPYGAADMAGNVWEWCADWYDEKEYQRRFRSVIKDPQGPSQGRLRVLRGGSWDSHGSNDRCAHRDWDSPDDLDNDSGFRLVGSDPFPYETLNH